MQRVQPTAKSPRSGSWVELGDGKEYLVPPIPLKPLEELLPALKKLQFKFSGAGAESLPGDEDLKTMRDFLSACVKRNYPELDLDQEDRLDLASVVSGFAYGVKVSGLEPAGAPTQGEPAAVTT